MRYPYQEGKADRFFAVLGFEMAMFALWVRSDLSRGTVDDFLTAAHDQGIFAFNLVRIVSILAKRERLGSLAGEQAVKARVLIEADADVDTRSSMFGALARAILPASLEEATVYFNCGLEQLDAIGSGDFRFCHELLSFTSKTEGKELNERRFHTLTNLLELNLGDGADNFPQVVFGSAFSRTAGLKGLAKLSRWDDRSNISLSCTLLPYLTALVENGKMEPKIALALNRLAKPREYFYASTKELAAAVACRAGPDSAVVGELIQQFLDDNPETAMDDTVEMLVSVTEKAFGPSSDQAHGIRAARERYSKVIDIHNQGGSFQEETQVNPHVGLRKDRGRIDSIALAVNPIDGFSLAQAISELNDLGNWHDRRVEFFDALRDRVEFDARPQYVRNIAELENLFFRWKLDELRECKARWSMSSSKLQYVYGKIASALVELHADELTNEGIGRLSLGTLQDIHDLTGVSLAELGRTLINLFTRSNTTVDSGVWVAFASLVLSFCTLETQSNCCKSFA